MFKTKDDVDSKEKIEKLGYFIIEEERDIFITYFEKYTEDSLKFSKSNRGMHFLYAGWGLYLNSRQIYMLYDLIKADLVEKVEEK